MAKPTKCEWGKKHVEYLANIVGNGQCKVPEARVKSVQDFKLPVTKKDIRAFLGTIGYYRKYIPNFASNAKPLTASTAKIWSHGQGSRWLHFIIYIRFYVNIVY